MNTQKKHKSFFYGWVIVVLSFTDLALVCGVWYGFSAFVLPFTREFGWSRALISGVFALNMSLYGFTGPIVGFLLDRFGARRMMAAGAALLALGLYLTSRAQSLGELYFAYGFLAGLGGSFMGSIPHNTVLSNWFEEKRGLALGTASAGMGAGMLVFIPIMQYVIVHRGWRDAFLLMAILIGLMVPIILIFQRHRPSDMGLLPDGKAADGASSLPRPGLRPRIRVVDYKWATKEWTVRTALNKFRFWAVFTSFTVFAFSVQIILLNQIPYFDTLQIDSIKAASILGAVGLVSSISKFGWGAISDFLGRERTYSLASALFISGGGALMLMPYYDPGILTVFYVVLFGIGYGAGNPIGFSIAADLFQGKHLGSILGILGLGIGVGFSLGPWLAGWLYDLNGGYHLAFTLALLANLISVVAVWAASSRKVRAVSRRSVLPT